jgi:hypothetical protein
MANSQKILIKLEAVSVEMVCALCAIYADNYLNTLTETFNIWHDRFSCLCCLVF